MMEDLESIILAARGRDWRNYKASIPLTELLSHRALQISISNSTNQYVFLDRHSRRRLLENALSCYQNFLSLAARVYWKSRLYQYFQKLKVPERKGPHSSGVILSGCSSRRGNIAKIQTFSRQLAILIVKWIWRWYILRLNIALFRWKAYSIKNTLGIGKYFDMWNVWYSRRKLLRMIAFRYRQLLFPIFRRYYLRIVGYRFKSWRKLNILMSQKMCNKRYFRIWKTYICFEKRRQRLNQLASTLKVIRQYAQISMIKTDKICQECDKLFKRGILKHYFHYWRIMRLRTRSLHHIFGKYTVRWGFIFWRQFVLHSNATARLAINSQNIFEPPCQSFESDIASSCLSSRESPRHSMTQSDAVSVKLVPKPSIALTPPRVAPNEVCFHSWRGQYIKYAQHLGGSYHFPSVGKEYSSRTPITKTVKAVPLNDSTHSPNEVTVNAHRQSTALDLSIPSMSHWGIAECVRRCDLANDIAIVDENYILLGTPARSQGHLCTPAQERSNMKPITTSRHREEKSRDNTNRFRKRLQAAKRMVSV